MSGWRGRWGSGWRGRLGRGRLGRGDDRSESRRERPANGTGRPGWRTRAVETPDTPDRDGGHADYDRPVIALADAGVVVPAWTLRLVMAALCGVLVGSLYLDGAPPVFVVVLVLAALATVVSPSSAAAAGLAGATVLGLVMVDPGGDDPLRLAVLASIFLVHLIHVMSGIAALVPLAAALHLPALRRPLARFLVIQAATFALVGFAAVLPAGQNPVPLEVAAVLGVTGVAVLSVVLLRRR